MTVWSHLSTILGMRLNRRFAFSVTVIFTLCIALITTLIFSSVSQAAPGVNQTIGFQGRLLDSNGNVVPNGYYNIQFKIYQDGTGTTAGNTNGTLKWTETYINNGGNNGVEVKNGYLSVNLGSRTPFSSNVDWNQDTLWLSMNIAGSATNCTTFNAGDCEADGEMLPMKRLTSTPYALNSGQLGGKTANNFVQLGQGVQVDNSQASSIFINKTDSGNLIQLQKNASDIFTVTNAGDITLGSDTNKSITVAAAGADASGKNITIAAGAGGSGTGSAGGDIILEGGAAGGTNANGGNIILSGGAGAGTGGKGLVIIDTPTFATAVDDANCYASGAPVAASCTITSASVNSSAGVLVGFSETDQVATLPDPIIKTAGRVTYIMAAPDSEPFTLSINGGGAGNEISLKPNTSTALVWNGNDWTTTGATAAKALEYSSDNAQIQVGDGLDEGEATVLTLDKGDSAPTVTDTEAMLGSMYYDTTLGKIQCYEADGWGACSSSPDNFVSLSPEYSNAVLHGADQGTISSDFCSDTLNINDGSSAQPTICGTDETYNFYQWTTDQTTAKTKSIFVTYQLPPTFNEFIATSTSLIGRTDSSDASVSYQVYRKTDAGLTACGSEVAVSTGAQTAWQSGDAINTADPANCGFTAGDSIVFKINLTSANDANAWASDLNFAFSNQ